LATEKGFVTKVDSTFAWVKVEVPSACESCAERSSCSSMRRDMEVKAINDVNARVGDRIILGIDTSSLIKTAFLLYMFPILCMLAGAFIGWKISLYCNYDGSVFSIISGFLLFFTAFIFIKSKGNRLARKREYKPRIIRII